MEYVVGPYLYVIVVGEIGDHWQSFFMQISQLTNSYYLFWRATRGDGDTSDIAMDEISVCPGEC